MNIVWANFYNIFDTTSGASRSANTMLRSIKEYYPHVNIKVLGTDVCDTDSGQKKFYETYLPKDDLTKVDFAEATIDGIDYSIQITGSPTIDTYSRKQFSQWYAKFYDLLDNFKPSVILTFGGAELERHMAHVADQRDIPVVSYVVNPHYKGKSWSYNTSLIITDTEATASFYKKVMNYDILPVGKFIGPENIAPSKDPKFVTFINPSWEKGVGLTVGVAEYLEKRRPDIRFQVVESRGDWNNAVENTFLALDQKRYTPLQNVVMRPNTRDMRPIYQNSRLLFLPSLWWESGARVIAEAQLNAIPVLATDHGGNREMVGSGGMLFKLPEHCHEEPYNHILSQDGIAQIAKIIEKYFDDEDFYESQSNAATNNAKQKFDRFTNTKKFYQLLSALPERSTSDYVSEHDLRHKQLGSRSNNLRKNTIIIDCLKDYEMSDYSFLLGFENFLHIVVHDENPFSDISDFRLKDDFFKLSLTSILNISENVFGIDLLCISLQQILSNIKNDVPIIILINESDFETVSIDPDLMAKSQIVDTHDLSGAMHNDDDCASFPEEYDSDHPSLVRYFRLAYLRNKEKINT